MAARVGQRPFPFAIFACFAPLRETGFSVNSHCRGYSLPAVRSCEDSWLMNKILRPSFPPARGSGWRLESSAIRALHCNPYNPQNPGFAPKDLGMVGRAAGGGRAGVLARLAV